MPFELTGTALARGKPIPAKYSCDGQNISPPLQWTAPPQNTRSFALIKEQLLSAMKGHILGQAELMATYNRRLVS